MKTITLLACLAALTSGGSSTVLRAAAACCAVPAESQETGAIAPVPLPARSLFQFDGKLTDDAGRTLALRDLRGETLVVTMMFTHCAYACPMLVNDLRKIREQLPPAIRSRVRFVLVSFDTARDTVEVLSAYRAAQTLDDRWTLLRGQAADTQTLAMLLGVQFRREANGQFGHSNVITVLNPEGEIVHQRLGLQTSLVAVTDAILRSTASHQGVLGR